MPLTASQIRTLKRKAADNSLEVEHLIKVAMIGDASAAPVLRELSSQNGWSVTDRDNPQQIDPFGRWVEVICAYLERGYSGILQYSRKSKETFEYAMGLLEELKTTESVCALVTLGSDLLNNPSANQPRALKMALAFNRLLSFKASPVIDEQLESKIRSFLHKLLRMELNEAERSWIVCALRGVGNVESIEMIAKLPSFKYPNEGLEKSAIRQIKSRLKNQSN